MKANELRIWNWVMIDTIEKPQQVIDVLCDSVNTANVHGAYYGMVEAIPLTEEWLLKFGFEKIKEDIFSLIKDNKKVCTISKYNFGRYEYTQLTVHGLYIEYVHQLQNLYFTLNGEELIDGGNK